MVLEPTHAVFFIFIIQFDAFTEFPIGKNGVAVFSRTP